MAINHTVVSIGGSRKKTKESIRVESLFPEEMRQSSSVLIDLLKDYYEHMNEHNQPSYEIDSINEVRDIDTPHHDYLNAIQKEIAVALPGVLVADKVKLYKNLVQYYRLRGSSDSIELFFKIIFQDNVEVYYPRVDMLAPSSGAWDLQSRKPARVLPFDQKQPIKFNIVVNDGDTFEKGEIIANDFGVTATVDSQVGDVVTVKALRIPEKTAYAEAALSEYLACSFTAVGGTVNLTAHGFVNGDEVTFSSISTSIGIAINTNYYVVNAAANTFRLALTPGGTPINFIANGTGNVVKFPELATFGQFNLKRQNNVIIGTARARAIKTDLDRASTDNHTHKIYLFDVQIHDVDTHDCTFTAVGGTVNLTNHGFLTGDRVSFSSITGTTELFLNKDYYLVNVSANTFRLALTPNGLPISFAADGTGVLNIFYVLSDVRKFGDFAETPRVVLLEESVPSTFNGFVKDETILSNFLKIPVDGGGYFFPNETVTIQNNVGEEIATVLVLNFKNNVITGKILTGLLLDSAAVVISNRNEKINRTLRNCVFTGTPSHTVNLNDHKLLENDRVSFSLINTTTGLFPNIKYYVVDATSNTFKLALTLGGTSINFTQSGTGIINLTINSSEIEDVADSGIQFNTSKIRAIYQDGAISFILELRNLGGPYAVGERITGDLSNSFADVVSYDTNEGTLKVINPSGSFQIGENIVGETTTATSLCLGIYNPGNYISNDGFLSDEKKIQDSYYYQQFSYVIKTGLNLTSWKNEFNRLVHPAGFIFFADVLILLKLLDDGETKQVFKQNRLKTDDILEEIDTTLDPQKAGLTQWLASKMTSYQPGFIGIEDIPLLILCQAVTDTHYIITDETLLDNAFFIPKEIVVGITSGVRAEVQAYESIKYYTTADDTPHIGTEGSGSDIKYIKRKYGHTILHKVGYALGNDNLAGLNQLGLKNFYEGEIIEGLTSGTRKTITPGIQFSSTVPQTYYLNLNALSVGNNPVPYRVGETVNLYSNDVLIATAKVLAYRHVESLIAIHRLDGTIESADKITGESTQAARSVTEVKIGAYRTTRSGKASWDLNNTLNLILRLVAQNSNHLDRLKSQYSKQLKFFDNTPMSDYANYVIENDINNSINWNNVGSSIQQIQKITT